MREREYCVYILTNNWHTVLYIGVTGDLRRRMYEHKNKLVDGFTKKYNADQLVYFECGTDAYGVISREKQLKGWTRAKKFGLITRSNPAWNDLTDSING